MATEEEGLSQFGLGEVANTKLEDELSAYVQRSYTDARQHKQNAGITERLLRNLRAKKCKYQPDEETLLGPYNDVYVGLCSLKARAASSWLVDIISSNIEKPWTLDPTPEPQLPERLMDQAINMLIAELPKFETFDALKDRATQVKSALQEFTKKEATDATKRMETRIDDQMTEADWLDIYAQFIDDVTVFPSAFLRGPIEISKLDPEWKGDKFVVRKKAVPAMRVISPFDAYPAPNATSIQHSEYFIEAREWRHAEVHNLIGVASFVESTIRQVLKEYEDGYVPTKMEDNVRADLEDRDKILRHKKGLEVVIFNGKILGKHLIKHGAIVDDPQKHYEAEVWCIGNYTIRAVLNPNPVGERPVYSTAYTKVNGSIWGQSVIDLVYDTQRVCNASVRSLVRNMGYSSGPIGEVVSDRLAETEDELSIAPYKIYRVGPDITGTGAPAFRFHNVSSIANELLAVYNHFSKVADDLSGVPSYVLGNPQVAGAGRTLGGLSMLMGNAAKGIKNVQLNIDRDVISRVVAAYYYYNMVTSNDAGIKADAKVVARGATGLLQRELAQTRTVEVLQLLTPYAQQGLIDKSALDYILRAILQNTGLPVDKIIPDPDEASNVQELSSLLGAQTQAFNRGTSSPVPLPPQSQAPPTPANLAPFPQPVNLAQGA
jgi:hypothetical protein